MDNALMVGMTPDEFWYGDPELYYNYARVYELNFKQSQRDIWQIGARVRQALESTPIMPLGVMDYKDIKKAPQYPECPYTNDPVDSSEMSEEEIRLEREKFLTQITNWVNASKRK